MNIYRAQQVVNGCCPDLLLNSMHVTAKVHKHSFHLTNRKGVILQTRLPPGFLKIALVITYLWRLHTKFLHFALRLSVWNMQAACGNSYWADVPFKICWQEGVNSCFSLFMNCNATRNLTSSNIVPGQNIAVCTPIGHVSAMLWSILGYPC